MVRKKGKPGKKIQKGGYKSEPKVQTYFDLDIISKDELKKYIALLEKELEEMRKECAFYSLNKDKIKEFLEARRDSYKTEKEKSFVRNSGVCDLQEKLRNDPVKDNERYIIKDKEKIRQRQLKMFQDFIKRCSVEDDNFNEKHYLEKQIMEKEKLLQSNQYMYEIAMADQKEAYQSAQESLDLNYKNKLESILQEYLDKSVKANLNFNSEKLRALISIWDIKSPPFSAEKESFINEVKRMQDFFIELSSSNAEVNKMFQGNFTKLKNENKNLEFHLKKIIHQNMELRNSQVTVEPLILEKQNRVSENLKMAQSEKKLAKLQFKNDVLAGKLRMAKEDLQIVKKQFITATRHVREKAEFKTYMIEEILRLTLEAKAKALEKKVTKCKKSVKITTTQRAKSRINLNIFKMKVEDSNTLFVPPVYPEFWQRRETSS